MYCCKKKRPIVELDNEILQLETEFLRHSKPNLEAREVNIEVAGKQVRVHVLCGQLSQDRPSLVFVHGFGCTSALYYAFLTEAAKHFNVYAIDLPGMGCSGKPNLQWTLMTGAQVVDFYADSLRETTRVLGLAKFHLAAHSLGAYLTFYFLRKYPDQAMSFSAISAGGMTGEPADFAARLKKKKLPLKSNIMRWMWGFLNKSYFKGHTAVSLLPIHYLITKWTADKFEFKNQEMKSAINLVTAVFKHPDFSIDILPKVFGFRAYSRQPVVDFLQDIERQVPVMHLFGQNDWMDKYAFSKFVKENQLLSRIELIDDVGHQIPNFKPTELCNLIVDFTTNDQTHKKQLIN